MLDLNSRVNELAHTPILLVASDFDGTLAPIVNDPAAAEARRESLVALKALAALPQTHVAVISGRALADLARKVEEAGEAHLVGSHGSEFEAGFAASIPPQNANILKETIAAARKIAERTPGVLVETKPASVAFHYRNAEEKAAEGAAQELLDRVRVLDGVQVRQGKKVIELSVVRTDKGQALQTLRQRLGPTAVLFLGDDVTDEDAFKTLTGPDVGVKVGDGTTTAAYRVVDTLEVARLLAMIAEKRAAWLAGGEAIGIERHSLLSDQRTMALVDPRGRVSWLCMPRLDSAAIFAELLGGPTAGFFEVRPAERGGPARQAYAGSTFLLVTDWGSMRVTDYLDCSAGRAFQRAGRTDLVRVIEGTGRVRITFAPRLSFGEVETRLRVAPRGIEVQGAIEPCVLYAPGVEWTVRREGPNDMALAEVELGAKPLVLELRYGTANLAAAKASEAKRRAQTAHFWEAWAATLTLPAVQREMVLRSALVLRALVYGPTGAIAAAATTSLPEHAGGVRNWDYRYCWPRDAAMAAAALVRLGAAGVAMKLLDWMLGLLEGTAPGTLVRPVYTVTGGHLGAEGVIAGLSGYRGSRPVRVGNNAAHQVQLDVLGPVADLLALKAQQGAALTPEHWRLTASMVEAVSNRWQEEDHGIWEVRGPRRHHVHSKVTCWQTVDCALRVADYMGYQQDAWRALRDTIAADVLAQGWNERRQAFCSYYGSPDIDAAALWVGLSGLLPPEDPRFRATVAAVEQELLDSGTVYRYRCDDGLPGQEGGFNLCTSWLIEAYALQGRWTEAEKLFDQYVALAGPTGLMAEEYDPAARRALGNYPQAYSHIGLINAAVRLAAHREQGQTPQVVKSEEDT
jgi:trehalose 6-phosphate phosphatase